MLIVKLTVLEFLDALEGDLELEWGGEVRGVVVHDHVAHVDQRHRYDTGTFLDAEMCAGARKMKFEFKLRRKKILLRYSKVAENGKNRSSDNGMRRLGRGFRDCGELIHADLMACGSCRGEDGHDQPGAVEKNVLWCSLRFLFSTSNRIVGWLGWKGKSIHGMQSWEQ